MIKRIALSLVDNPLLRRAFTNTSWLFGADGVTSALALIQSALVARLLGPSGFGSLAVVLALVTSTNRLTSFRMNEFVIRYLPAGGERRPAIVKAAILSEFGSSLLAFLLLLAVADPAGDWLLGGGVGRTAIRVYAVVVLGTSILESTTGVLQLSNRFRTIATAQIATSSLSLLGVAFVFWRDGGLVAVAGAYAFGRVVPSVWLSVVGLIEARKRTVRPWWSTSLDPIRPQRREMANFAISTHLRGSLGLINKEVDPLLLGIFRPPAEVGIYKLALSLTSLLAMPVNALSRAVYPEMSRMAAQNDMTRLRKLATSSSLIAGVWIVIAGGTSIVALPHLIPVVYGSEFSQAYSAYLILLIGIGIGSTLFWTTPALLAQGRADLPLKISTGQAVLKVVLVVLLVPNGGFPAMAAIMTVIYTGGGVVGRHLATTTMGGTNDAG